jgi:eukaryotic-like serine/threonine-protein kinase
MTPERWRRVEQLYHAALTRDADHRAAFLAEACAGDEALRREVESLVNQPASAEGFLAGQAIGLAAQMVSRPDSSTLIGQHIGVYEVQMLLGAGGMGEIYRAHDTKLNRPVAIKVLSDVVADAAARRRFQREAQTASSLNHPHILTVYDVGEIDGRQYLVTEFVDGGTLREWAQAEERTWPQIVELLAGVATAWPRHTPPASCTGTSNPRTFSWRRTATRSWRTSVSRSCLKARTTRQRLGP